MTETLQNHREDCGSSTESEIHQDPADSEQDQFTTSMHEIQRINAQLDAIHEPVITQVEDLLSQSTGTNFGSFEANREFAKAVQSLLNRFPLRIRCPKSGKPSRIVCERAGRAKHGSFKLRYSENGRSMVRTTSVTFPSLELVPFKRVSTQATNDKA